MKAEKSEIRIEGLGNNPKLVDISIRKLPEVSLYEDKVDKFHAMLTFRAWQARKECVDQLQQDGFDMKIIPSDNTARIEGMNRDGLDVLLRKLAKFKYIGLTELTASLSYEPGNRSTSPSAVRK